MLTELRCTSAVASEFLVNRLGFSPEAIAQELAPRLLVANVASFLLAAAVTDRLGHRLAATAGSVALGALWIHRRADDIGDPLRFLGMVQWAMGLLALATLPLYVESFDWMARLLSIVPRTDAGYRQFLGARYGIAVAIMLIFAEQVGNFVNRHPSMKILALAFLLLIGVLLTAEGLNQHIDKRYIYFAMGFSLIVELLNLRFRSKERRRASQAPEP